MMGLQAHRHWLASLGRNLPFEGQESRFNLREMGWHEGKSIPLLLEEEVGPLIKAAGFMSQGTTPETTSGNAIWLPHVLLEG